MGLFKRKKQGLRERAANELNDHLLQDMQGLILQFHRVNASIPSQAPARQLMENVLKRADQLLTEFRDRSQALANRE